MRRVLILGGGFGGISTAHGLRARLDDADEIVLVDRADAFAMGFHKVAIAVGREKPGDGRRPLAALAKAGIRFRQGSIEQIEPAARAAVVDGERIEADALVVALGAEGVPGAIPGLAEHGINVYSSDGAARAAEALAALSAGRVAIGIFGAPFPCPPAPFELALLAHGDAADRGAQLKFTIFSPLPMSIPALGQAGCNPFEARVAELGIEFRPNTKATAVEAKRIVFEGGGLPFDLLLAVPPHRCPRVCVDAGLAPDGGWIKVNPKTLETGVEGVWALGDATGVPLSNGQPLPKAGALADAEGRVVAERIAAHLAGGSSDARFAGEGACFLEVGRGEAMMVRGRFFEDPPQVELTQPSAAALEEKHAFERERLDAWFGAA